MLLLGIGCSAWAAGTQVRVAPDDGLFSNDYKLQVNGKPVEVYRARTLDAPFADKQWDYGGPYSFANFDVESPVEIRITSERDLGNTVIRPASDAVKMEIVDSHTLVLKLCEPRKFSIEPDGFNGPLLLFGNPPERNIPDPNDPNVIYFGPGVHKPEKITLTDHQTLYLSAGAVVKAGVEVRGTNIRIAGRGILDASDWKWRHGPFREVIPIFGTHVVVEDITVRGPYHWTIVPRNSRHVTVRNVKICGSRVQNDDGINPCNSSDVLITDCFIRTDDDCIAMKGFEYTSAESNVERITVENCIFWCDRARIFLLGHESRAAYMRDIRLQNLDIIHFSMFPFLFEPGEDMRLENITVENVRLNGNGQHNLIRLRPMVNKYMHKQVPGFVRDVRFKNIEVDGTPGPYLIEVIGADATHTVEDVVFENVVIAGEPLDKEAKRMKIGAHTENIRIEHAN